MICGFARLPFFKHPTIQLVILQLKVEVLSPLIQMFVQYTQKKTTLLNVNAEVRNPRGKMSHWVFESHNVSQTSLEP